LEQWNKEYLETGQFPKVNNLKTRWNQEKPEWVYESPKDANQQPFGDLNTALSRWVKKISKFPRFKSKHSSKDSFYVSNDKFRLLGKAVRLPKIGWISLAEELRFCGKIASATVSREADKWFLVVSVLMEDYTLDSGDEVLGVDLGIKTAVVLSDGTEYPGPKPYKVWQKRLATLQRRMSKKQKGSKNYDKAKLLVAKLHAKIRNIRQDFLHKTTSELVSRAKTIVIEDLNVRGMLKNHCLAKAIADMGFYEFKRQLIYKCKLGDVRLVVADRFYPSTKRCSNCGEKKDMPLSMRTYNCPHCGFSCDRDINAALNLRTLGLRGT